MNKLPLNATNRGYAVFRGWDGRERESECCVCKRVCYIGVCVCVCVHVCR